MPCMYKHIQKYKIGVGIDSMNEKDAIALLEKHIPKEGQYKAIRAHCQAVQKVAVQLAEQVQQAGHEIDLELVSIASLLHDIGRGQCPPGTPDSIKHGVTGAEILRKEMETAQPEDKGMLELCARVCERHTGAGIREEDIIKQNLPLPHKDFLPESVEEKIICHADNLIFGTREGTEEEVVERYRKELGEEYAERITKLASDVKQLTKIKYKIDLGKLKEEQRKLAKSIITKDEFKLQDVKLIGGCDQTYRDNTIITCIVVVNLKTLELVEKVFLEQPVTMPYIAGYLAYREMPVIVKAFEKLQNKPDVLFVDGDGILHPRRIGMASHLGLLLDLPTLGVSKKLTMGDVKEGKIYVGTEMRGVKLITKEYAKPIFVSSGHNIGIGTAVKLVKDSMKENHKMPEPLHLAHKFVNRFRKGKLKE
jgi:deoxyribonuclease V